MKKRLLLIGALIGSTFIYAQSLDVENYDGLALGNTHSAADLTFAAGAGTGGYFRSLSNGDTTLRRLKLQITLLIPMFKLLQMGITVHKVFNL
ncbi:hypothetical protein JCM19294_310 [Nonlabens tegetincola]|uniref:Outer membrane protein beta-barrel domain-containing protein n=1 Tax=Nonlabens tegetincola TaxID=323273 RepID=A0A090QQJ1_9FLAO|nr:hypothetical protein [Nonlabens tegetincola]GAK97771.1 hypothetical protein JCM19294_310 [Nonlabens tegetincola]